MISFKHLGRLGRLGNQLFQIASTIGIANKKGDKASFPRWKYQHIYNVPNEYFMGAMGTDIGQKYLQDYTNFHHLRNELVTWFMPKIKPNIKIADNTCAIHIRRTDYLQLADYHHNLPREYYEKAMEMMSDKCEQFLIFSDDPAWCRKEFIAIPVMDARQDWEDLYLMSQCKHFIIANSSFSWWAAYLSGSTSVIAPAKWFGDKMQTKETFNFYLPEWTVI